METPDTPRTPLLAFSRPFLPGKRAFWVLLCLTLLATAFELAVPLLARELIDQLAVGSADRAVLGALTLLVLLTGLSEYLAAVHASRMGLDTTRAIRFRLIGHLVGVRSASLHEHHSSELAARVMADSEELNQVFSTDLAGLIAGLVSFVAVMGVLVWLDWRLTLVIFACLLVGVVLITPIALSMSALNKKQLALYADVTRQLSEWFRHHELVKVYGAREQIDREARRALDEYVALAMREARAMSAIGPISNFLLMGSLIALIATSAYWIAQGTMTMGTFTAFLLYLFGLTFPLISMGMFFANFHKAGGAAVRLRELLDLPLERVAAGEETGSITSLQVQAASLELGGHRILRALSLPPLDRGLVMVSGPSGCGKTSLMRVLLGLYDLESGSVRINDRALSAEELAGWRDRLAWVEQEPALFQATVRENLCLGRSGIADERLFEALAEAGLESWLERIDRQLDLLLTEQNNQLSGGEKQRFALARALVRPFDVLLLDEPTSALDKSNTARLMDRLAALAKDKLVIMITHDDSLLPRADRVVRLDSGQLATGDDQPG